MKDSKPKIAVVHDHLGFVGGGERTVMLLALDLGADFITAYADPDTFADYQEQLGYRLKVLSQKVVKTKGVRFFWIRGLFLKNRELFKDYDILIVSGHSSTDVATNVARKGAAKILYVHNPPRRVYDLYEVSRQSYPFYLRPLYSAFVRYWKWEYLRAFRKYDFTIANSEHIKNQVLKFTGNSVNAVVWPPIMTDNFQWLSDGDYFLSWARVDEMKRIDLIVRAFKKMPEEKLVIASSGPKIEEIRELALGYPNILVVGFVPDRELFELAGRCRAAVYIPVNEDAGMTHIEANSAGKPVIAVREGGLIESVIDGETGVFVPADPQEHDVMAAVKMMSASWCASKRKTCIDHARKFDQQIFFDKMRSIIAGFDSSQPLLGIDCSRWEDPRYPGEGRRTGVEVVAKNVIERLVPLAQQAGWRVRLYAPRLIDSFPAEIQKVLPGRKRWSLARLAPELKNSPPDYFFTPAYYIPQTAPKKSFAIIHDVLFKSHPQKYSLPDRAVHKLTTRWNLKRSRKIITVSEFSKKEITRYYAIDPDMIIVAPLGHETREGLVRCQMREKIILYIGRVEKKKSIDVLVYAFWDFSRRNKGWRLVLAGASGFGAEDIKKLVCDLGIEERVDMPGFVSEEAKWNYLARASAFIHPSAHEGSCLPLFEAWDAEIPAIVSDAPVMREVGGDGALYFAAGDDEDLAEKLEAILKNDKQKHELIIRGRERLKNMSWEKTAAKVLEAIRGDANNANRRE